MHERSLVASLIRQAEDVVRQNGGGSLREVTVEIGPLSGVERLLVESAFRESIPGTAADSAALIVEEVPLTARCCDCDRECVVEQFRFECPHCGSVRLQVTGGDAFRLMSVTFESGSAVE